MSWAGDRLLYLLNKHSYRDIQEVTGIPISTISYVVKDQRLLPAKYILNLRSMFERQVYTELRAMGMTPSLARRFRSYAVPHIQTYLSKASDTVNMLVDYRFDTYNNYLKKVGRWQSDDATRAALYESISKSLLSSPRDTTTDEGKNDSPSIRHIIEYTTA